MRCWVLALALWGCGDVNLVSDAGLPDAYQPDGVPMVSCAASETVCNGATCADTMTDELNCGGCNTQCAPTQTCESGTCTPITTCNQVQDRNPQAVDGPYYTPSNTIFYCDFTNHVDYQAFGFGGYDVTYPDYALMSSTELQDPAVQRAFIALVNAQGGLLNIAPGLNPDNCCLKLADAGPGEMLLVNGQYVYPAFVGADQNICGGPYNDPKYRYYVINGEYMPLPMPTSYFATRTITVGPACSDGANPGIFVRKGPIH
jgi:hypothetical protein